MTIRLIADWYSIFSGHTKRFQTEKQKHHLLRIQCNLIINTI